jgi:predicted nucleic acid-binding Zn ribbon protein
MPGGRPTRDPKESLVAVRLASRQLHALEARARREGIGISEALRRVVDDWASAPSSRPSLPSAPRARPPALDERKTFDQVFAAIGLTPKQRKGRQR